MSYNNYPRIREEKTIQEPFNYTINDNKNVDPDNGWLIAKYPKFDGRFIYNVSVNIHDKILLLCTREHCEIGFKYVAKIYDEQHNAWNEVPNFIIKHNQQQYMLSEPQSLYFDRKTNIVYISHIKTKKRFTSKDEESCTISLHGLFFDVETNSIKNESFNLKCDIDCRNLEENCVFLVHTDPQLIHVLGNFNDDGSDHDDDLSLKHYLWNISENKSKLITETIYGDGMSLVYLQSKQLIFMCGGFEIGGASLGIWRFSMKQEKKQWEKLSIPLPLKYVDIIVTSDENNIVLFGGYDITGGNSYYKMKPSQKIMTLNVESNDYKLIPSNVECAIGGECMVISIGGGNENELLVIGWIKNLFKTHFMNMPLPPMYLMKSLASWYKQETIHWFVYDKACGPQHQAINVTSILKSE